MLWEKLRERLKIRSRKRLSIELSTGTRKVSILVLQTYQQNVSNLTLSSMRPEHRMMLFNAAMTIGAFVKDLPSPMLESLFAEINMELQERDRKEIEEAL